MIEPTNPEQARKCLMLASSGPAARAWLDGYNGVDQSDRFSNKSDKDFYETYWLKGSIYKDQEKVLNGPVSP